MKPIRPRLTYANVMSTVFVLLAIGGATAVASGQLAKNSVGTAQLKGGAVTTAKIKKNAVTKAKVKKGAIDSSKIADNSVTGADINAPTTSFSRIVHEARGSTTVELPNSAVTAYPLTGGTYTQEAGSDDSYMGAVDVTIPSSCKEQRSVAAYLLMDAADPSKPTLADIVAAGAFEDKGAGDLSRRITLGSFVYGGTKFQQSSPVNHSLSLVVIASCKSGSGIKATSGAVDVIGVK